MILWSSFQPCQDLGPGGSERRAVGAQVMIITMLMFTVFMTLMIVVVEMTRGSERRAVGAKVMGTILVLLLAILLIRHYL